MYVAGMVCVELCGHERGQRGVAVAARSDLNEWDRRTDLATKSESCKVAKLPLFNASLL